jgi:hypothetical protein
MRESERGRTVDSGDEREVFFREEGLGRRSLFESMPGREFC